MINLEKREWVGWFNKFSYVLAKKSNSKEGFTQNKQKYFGRSKTFIKISKTVTNKECAKKERA